MTNALQVIPQMSLIENIDIDAVKGTIEKVKKLQATLKGILVKGHDYDTIPGCGTKETLLKPGAEKILMALGVTSTYELIEHTEDFTKKGFFAYTVKCNLLSNGAKITEGLGHANSKEKKWAFEWVKEKDLPDGVDKALLQHKKNNGKYGDYFTYMVDADANSKANTILKMAKKRSQIDAVLTIASLSEVFTQDFDDIVEEEATTQPIVDKVKEKVNQKQNDNSELKCVACDADITEKVYKYSLEKFNQPLCFECQKTYKNGYSESETE